MSNPVRKWIADKLDPERTSAPTTSDPVEPSTEPRPTSRRATRPAEPPPAPDPDPDEVITTPPPPVSPSTTDDEDICDDQSRSLRDELPDKGPKPPRTINVRKSWASLTDRLNS